MSFGDVGTADINLEARKPGMNYTTERFACHKNLLAKASSKFQDLLKHYKDLLVRKSGPENQAWSNYFFLMLALLRRTSF